MSVSFLSAAERKTSLGKDWHSACLRCEKCNKTLTPGSHAEHDGKPYCNQPCYAALFGPAGKRLARPEENRKWTGNGPELKEVARDLPIGCHCFWQTMQKKKLLRKFPCVLLAGRLMPGCPQLGAKLAIPAWGLVAPGRAGRGGAARRLNLQTAAFTRLAFAVGRFRTRRSRELRVQVKRRAVTLSALRAVLPSPSPAPLENGATARRSRTLCLALIMPLLV